MDNGFLLFISIIYKDNVILNHGTNFLIALDDVVYLGSLNDINPNDIASFDVLKDAVSAAAYNCLLIIMGRAFDSYRKAIRSKSPGQTH